jgi:hypothetical protein
MCFATFAQFFCYNCLCGSATKSPARDSGDVSGEVGFATFSKIFCYILFYGFATIALYFAMKHPARVPGNISVLLH